MTDHLLKFKPGIAVTFTASTSITGGQVVEVTGARTVGVPATAKSAKVIGTAGFDAAVGETVVVFLAGPVDTVVAAGAVTAGSRVAASTDGKVAAATAGDPTVGIALTAATQDGDVIEVVRTNDQLGLTGAGAVAAVAGKTEIAALSAVTTADATDLATTTALVNELKATVNAIIAALQA